MQQVQRLRFQGQLPQGDQPGRQLPHEGMQPSGSDASRRLVRQGRRRRYFLAVLHRPTHRAPASRSAPSRQPPHHRLAVIARYRHYLVQDSGLLGPVGLGVTLALSPDVLGYAVLIHGYFTSHDVMVWVTAILRKRLPLR